MRMKLMYQELLDQDSRRSFHRKKRKEMVSVGSGIMRSADLKKMNACFCMRKPLIVAFRIDAEINSDVSSFMKKLHSQEPKDLF